MKTKISHLGRSSVSVILAVMMLLSTMLIGTVSTVNAATSTKKVFLLNAANWKTPYAYCWDGSNENRKWPGIAMTKEGTKDGFDVYSYTPSAGYSKIIFNDSGNNATQTVAFDYPITDNQMYNNQTKEWSTYSGGSGGGSTSTDYYIAGRFKTKWDDITTAYKFIESSEQKGLYYYDTDETVASLSGKISEGTSGNFDRYFYIRSGNGKYLTSNDNAGHSFQNNKNSQNYLTLVTNDKTPEPRLIKFSDPSDPSNDKVTIWLDTTNNDMRLYYTAGSESSLTPVAESVTLTASSETVTSGGSTTLTATLTNKATGVDKVTYTFKKADGTVVGTVKDSAENTASVEVKNITSNTTYTVTVSADGYSDVTGSTTVAMPESTTLNFMVKSNDTDISKGVFKKIGDEYILDVTFDQTGDYKFYVKDDKGDNNPIYYRNENGILEDLTSNVILYKYGDNVAGHYVTLKVANPGTYGIKMKASGVNYSVSLYKIPDTSVTHTVNYGVNDEAMGSVKATYADSTSIGTSPASVEEGKSVTFTATAGNGYRFDGWYSDAGCTTAIEGATAATYTIAVTDNTTVYAKFVAETYNITVEENTNCTVTVNKTAAYGSNVNVRVNAKDGYTVSSISVTNVNPNDITGNETIGYTFRMPASNVEITPNVVAVEVTAPKVTLNTVTGASTANVSVKENYPITAFAEAGDAYSKITSKDISVSGGVENTNYTWAETSDGSGIYNFVALTKGTFTVTYTATATSINDTTKSTSATATLKITASYTPTQQAYVDLETYVNNVKNTSADSYTTDSYAAFFAALTSAKGLLKGLPNAGASNTDEYTTALNDLTVAYNNLKSNKQYYILGHKAITGGAEDTSSATTHDKGIPMKDNGNGDYTYTFSSSDIKSGNDAFCFIDNNNITYKTNSADSINITDTKYTAESPYIVDISSAINGLYYFGRYDAQSRRYTIHLNTATNGKIKVWVEEAPLAYGLQGAVYASQSDSNPIGWSNYSEAMSFNAENNYTLKFYAKKTNSTENEFRLIDSAKTDYGSNIQSGLKVNLNTYYTTTKSNGYTYHVDYSNKPYTIKLNPGKTPPEFVVTQGTQHSVTVAPNIENGKISVDNAKPYEGDTVTVTANPESGYVLETVKFNGESANVVGNTATFTMPNADVTVTATFRTANKYKVTIANNITNGTVTANGSSKAITVTEGTSVKLVATPASSYSFSSWSITPENGYTAEGSMTSATATIYPTANITVSASFAQGTASADHFLAWGESDNIGDWIVGTNTYSSTDENSKKIYTTYLDTSLFKENTWYRFAVTKKIPSSNDRLNSGDLYYNTSDITVNNYPGYHKGDNVETERKENSQNYYGMFRYSGELESLSISYNEKTKNYQVTPVVKVHNGAKLYAKNGSCRTDNQYANNMHTKGTTTISYETNKYDVDVDTKSSSWQIAYLSEENIKDEVKLTITTTVKDSDYYLAGWCVDGETYLPKTSNTESNEYSFDYYVKSTTKLNDTIEVTPVYFYKTSADTETVRFYVTGFDDTVKKDWGNTIAVYPYYSGTGGNVFSNYPGQPMLMSGGRYYVDLPIKYNGGTIAGVTLNNYFYDDVHNGLVSSLGNRQTYDYNDFLKIYEQKISGSTERKSQEIIFSFKYVPSGTSGYNNFGDDSTGKGDKTSVTYPDTISADVMDTSYANGWEDLTDFYGNKVDLYDKKVDASSAAGKKNPWRVISNGYEQTYFGYYATRWAVYKPDVETGDVTRYSLVDVISSSSLLYNSYDAISADTTTYSAGDTSLSASSDAKAYKAFKDAGADGVPVKITYEQTIERKNSIEGQPNKNENAFRNDGRWYYSEDNLNVTAHTVIEYADTLDGFSGTLGTDFRRDYYQNGNVDYTKDGYDSSHYTGLTTRTSAYFTNDEYYKKTEAKGQTGSGKTFDIIANTDHASEYIFVGWYLLSEGKYSPLTSTVENSVSVPQDNNDVYVARFIKAPSGSLTISHKLHPNTTGLGKCYVSVDVLDKTGKVIHSYDETTSDITVSNAYITYGQGNKIKITLKTEPGEATTFNDFYSYSADFAKLVNTETGVVPAVTVTNDATTDTYKAEISFNVDDYLFDKDSTDHQQNIKVLNYFSQLSLGSVKYEIKYTFNTRLYGTKVYKVSDTLTADDISKYGCTENQLSESFVMAKAPFESNFKQNITWDSNEITFGSKADGTLTADITATQVEDKNVTATFRVDSESEAETITTNFGNRFLKDGSYISAKDTGITADVEGLPTEYQNTEGNFSFWYVMTTKNKEFVTKAYGQNFAYTGYDNYIVVAVYGVDGTHKDELTDSSINFLQYSRNHWNDTVTGKNDTGSYSLAGTEYDRLYADFNLMFNHNGLLLNNYSGTDIKVGYAMVVGSKKDGNYTVDQEELKTAILSNATDGGTVEHQSESVTAKQAVKVTDSDNDGAKKNVIVNSIRIADLDNKNRITSYYGFKNSEANQSYYVQVYSYVIADNQVTLSETPVVINLNDIGNKTYVPQQ